MVNILGCVSGMAKKRLGDGVYWTLQFDARAGHYACNHCFYGIGFRTISCENHILKRFWHATKSTKMEVVSAPQGIVITHVLVVVNKTIEAVHSRILVRATFYLTSVQHFFVCSSVYKQ